MPSPIKVQRHPFMRLIGSSLTYEAVLVAAAAFQASTTTFDLDEAGFIGTAYRDHKLLVGVSLLLISALSVVGLVVVKVLQSKRDDPLRWINPILSNLQVTLLAIGTKPEPDTRVRVYLLVPDDKHEYWLPVTPYMGDTMRSQLPAKMPRARDIAGIAIMQPMDVTSANCKSTTSPEDFLVFDLGFERHHLYVADKDFLSKAAFCVGKPNGSHMVLCCESTKPNFFSTQNKGRSAVIKATGMTLADQFGCR